VTIQGNTTKGFKLVAFNSDTWHTDEHDNWWLVDALLSAAFGDIPFAVAGGTADTITLDYTPDRVLANGLTIVFRLSADSTGATTVNVDGTGAKNLLLLGDAIAAGDLQEGDIVRAVYDGTEFNVIEPIRRITNLKSIGDLLVELSADGGISITGPDASIQSITFGDVSTPAAGILEYSHAANKFSFKIGGVSVLEQTAALLQVNTAARFKITNNDLVIEESSADVIRIGPVASATGFFVNTSTNVNAIVGNTGVTGSLTVSGQISGLIDMSNPTGTLGIANGGTGATSAANARTALGLGSIAVLNSVNGSNWSGQDLALADGGTGASTAAAAFANIAASGGTVGGAITRSAKGVYPFFNNAGMSSGEIFIQAIGADPTSQPGDIVFEY
jgi:hypothetical protein